MSNRLKTSPRWIIFLLDLAVVATALLFSKLIRYNFDLSLALRNFYFALYTVLAVNTLLFFVFKSYAGIVRYTTVRDTYRLLIIATLASVIYFIIGAAVYGKGFLLLSRATIVINFFISSFGLIGYRMLVRHLYKRFFVNTVLKARTKVAIYDTGEQGVLTKRVINDYPQSQMVVVAFLDETFNKTKKTMESLPIYDLRETSFARLQEEGVKKIIIANKEISNERLNEVVDKALSQGIRVQQIPGISQWLKNGLDSQQLKDINIEDLLEREVIVINNNHISRALTNKKILVTGAAGSIGSEIVRQVIQYKPELVVLCDNAETPMHEFCLEIKETFPNAPVRSYLGNISDRGRMEHLFEVFSPEVVFHAAAYKHVPLMEENPSIAVINNVLGTKILAEVAVAFQVEKFVMISTDKAVNPTNVMGASKRIAEIFTQSLFRKLAAEHESGKGGRIPTAFITTRFGNVLGSNGSVIPRFKKQIEKGGPITVTHPDITRYFMTIPEACQLVIEAGVMGHGGEIFVFDMGQPVRVADLAEKMIRLSGKVPGDDVKIEFTGLRPGEKLYEELLSNKENTLPTYHEKILIARVREYDFEWVSYKTEELLQTASGHFTMETVALMKQLVPEYISKNSTYEQLDQRRDEKTVK